MNRKLLLLAGTSEARTLARALTRGGVPVLASLAGITGLPADLGVPTRRGGFGGAEGLGRLLEAERIAAVLDAAHPFAARIGWRVAETCRAMGIPRVKLLRPQWEPAPGDLWTAIGSEGEACAVIPEGATVFLATGRQRIDRFAGLAGRRLVCRIIDPPEVPFPFPNGAWLVSRPPFRAEEEAALFRRLGIGWLVARNAGGAGSRPKLDAARALGLPVAMIVRPPQPPDDLVETVEAALDRALAMMEPAAGRAR